MIDIKELRIGNYVKLFKGVNDDGPHYEIYQISSGFDIFKLDENDCDYIEPIPITKENIEKYIDWSFEKGFNKNTTDHEFGIRTEFIMENIIDDSSDFKIVFHEGFISGIENLNQIEYSIDRKRIEFGLDDNLHNLQNLFYISTGQELPIK